MTKIGISNSNIYKTYFKHFLILPLSCSHVATPQIYLFESFVILILASCNICGVFLYDNKFV